MYRNSRRQLVLLMMVFYCCQLALTSIIIEDTSSEALLSELQLDDLELVDICDNIADATKIALLTHKYKEKIDAEIVWGERLRAQSATLKQFDDVPDDLQRNYTYLIHPGDPLLNETQWKQLITYGNMVQESTSLIQVPCTSQNKCSFTKTDYKNVLKQSRDLNVLKTTWEFWQDVYNDTHKKQFVNILKLNRYAALANADNSDVKTYWEYMNDISDGYERAEQLWAEIQPFYNKLHNFVRERLFNIYNINATDYKSIPVYLLGENTADWSVIADIILPHPQLHFDTESKLKHKHVQEFYKLANNVTEYLKIGQLDELMWKNSQFTMKSCKANVLTFCEQQYTEILECDTASLHTYLDAYESTFRMTLNSRDFTSLPRLSLRYSTIEEIVATLSTLLAIENLPKHNILDENIFHFHSDDDSNRMTKLLLTALRVVPRLAYYLAVDKWRLDLFEMDDDVVDERLVIENWWKFRQQYQNVSGTTQTECDFLDDEHVLFNKPYLSKFFGTIAAFQIVEYYLNNGNFSVEAMVEDGSFSQMLKDRVTTDWEYLLTLTYGVELSTSAFLDYFKPLDTYLVEAPLEQVAIVTTTTSTTTTLRPPTTTTIKFPQQKDHNIVVNQAILSDQPKVNESNSVASEEDRNKKGGADAAMYAGVGFLIAVACLLVGAFVYKKTKRRRRPNNRRFDG